MSFDAETLDVLLREFAEVVADLEGHEEEPAPSWKWHALWRVQDQLEALHAAGVRLPTEDETDETDETAQHEEAA